MARERALRHVLDNVLEVDHTGTQECLRQNGLTSMRDVLIISNEDICALKYKPDKDNPPLTYQWGRRTRFASCERGTRLSSHRPVCE